MEHVISATGETWTFRLSSSVSYTFSPDEPTAIGEADLHAVEERIGTLCLKNVTKTTMPPEETTPAPEVQEPAAEETTPASEA